jgi:hypothetical protein
MRLSRIGTTLGGRRNIELALAGERWKGGLRGRRRLCTMSILSTRESRMSLLHWGWWSNLIVFNLALLASRSGGG